VIRNPEHGRQSVFVCFEEIAFLFGGLKISPGALKVFRGCPRGIIMKLNFSDFGHQ
jgi:hypothetical protein